jgi:hypothetical protein
MTFIQSRPAGFRRSAAPVAMPLTGRAAVSGVLAAKRALTCRPRRIARAVVRLPAHVVLVAAVAHATAAAAEGKKRDEPGTQRQPDPVAAKPFHGRAPSAREDTPRIARERITGVLVNDFGLRGRPVTDASRSAFKPT